MDRTTVQRPPLFALVRELERSERLDAYAEALPAAARVGEPGLPLLAAALHERSPDRELVLLVPEDADARDAAEAIGWLVGEERVGLLPSRGVRWDSGLQPPPHLVGERARALDVLAAGGIVCVSAAALAEGLPPPAARTEPVRLRVGAEQGPEGLARELVRAGYERVERVDDRGQIAVRGGLLDVFPSTGREPLRVEFFGDEIESVRAFSPFTQRTLHPVEDAVVYPAAERPVDLAEPTLRDDDAGVHVPPADLVPTLGAPPDLVWEPDRVRAVWSEEGLPEVSLEGVAELDPFPRGQPFAFDVLRPALAARGLAEAE